MNELNTTRIHRLAERIDLISHQLTEAYHQTDQLDIANARQQDEIDYLRKRVEVLEMTQEKTNEKHQ
tara:strand:+ start:343 stop:543 length:201 start_codon:yes stop_codon:yes gene_type:complete